jgi:hypothetical protein
MLICGDAVLARLRAFNRETEAMRQPSIVEAVRLSAREDGYRLALKDLGIDLRTPQRENLLPILKGS